MFGVTTMSFFTIVAVLAFCRTANAGGLPSIRDSLTHPFHVFEGDDALITCVVRNIGDNTVTWKKEDKERHSKRVLTAGTTRVTGDKRFSVLHDAGGDVWVLVIENSKPSDTGLYVCEVNSTPVLRSFHKLNVVSRGLQPPENNSKPIIFNTEAAEPFNAKSHNYTDCCIGTNVTQSCLGFCNIQSILEGSTGEEPENCEADFPVIVKCMADGRNHAPCCEQEGVPDICQDVCRGEYTTITDNIKTHFSCSAYTEITLACIAEGIELLPSSPGNIDVTAVSENTIKVSWSLPEKNGPTVTNYLVNVTTLEVFDEDEATSEDSYASALSNNRKDEQKLGHSTFHEMKHITVPGLFQTTEVNSLKPYTMYEITVTATNKRGSSLPSYAVRAVTLNPGKRKNLPTAAPALPDLKSCCIEKGVTHASCLDKMCDPKQTDVANVPDLMICAPWASSTFSCLTNDTDHTDCCRARGMPPTCLEFCSGNVTQLDFSHFKCLKYMNDFSACLLKSYGVLPSQPRRLRINHIKSEYVIVNWEPPQTLGDTVRYYNLHYRMLAIYDNEYRVKEKVQPPYILENLISDVDYELYVEAINEHGVSDPSTRILFRTKSKLIEERADNINGYNLTSCCVQTGVSDMCFPLCSYDASMTDVKNLANVCNEELPKLIKCGAAGRNHESCCSRRGVPALCLPICSGAVSSSLFSSTCVPYIGNIVQCFEDGSGLLPEPVAELQATKVTENSVSLSWEAPQSGGGGGDDITFDVYYEKNNNTTVFKTDFNLDKNITTNGTSVVINNLEKDQLYNIFVVSRNAHGTSLPSSILMINATNMDLGSQGISAVTSPPHSLAVSSHSATYFTISWQPPSFSHFAEAISYQLHYKSNAENSFHIVNTTLTSHTLEGLTPNTQYICYVVALSKTGNSLPSETLIAWTDPAYPAFVEPPTVHPMSLVIEGSSMTILCIAMGTPMPNISLYISGRFVRQEATRHMVTVVNNVTRDMDQISCYADNGYGTPMQASRRITISHIPEISASGITIATYGDTVTLECNVDAHPAPKMMFWRDHMGRVPVIQGGKFDISFISNKEESTKYKMHLKISHLNGSDEGDYFCHAENAFGSATQPVSIRLRNTPSTSNISACCMMQNVSSACRDACSFFLDFDAIADRIECVADYDKLMHCAADGSDHRSCCAERGVPRRCLDWCRGEPLFNGKGCVLGNVKQIIGCFQDGRDNLPGPPQNVHVEPADVHSVYLKWDPPAKNPNTVLMYRVFWRQVGSRAPLKNDTKDLFLRITGLKDSAAYEFVVKAGNQKGTSTLTEPVRFTVGDKYIISSSSIDSDSSSAGAIIGVILALIIVTAVVIAALWFLKMRRIMGSKTTGGVAFENPSYLKEADRAQIPNGAEAASVPSVGGTNMVAPEDGFLAPQHGWKHESSAEVPPSLYEELKLGHDGVGFKRLKP